MPSWPHKFTTTRFHVFRQKVSQVITFPFSHYIVSQLSCSNSGSPYGRDCPIVEEEEKEEDLSQQHNHRSSSPYCNDCPHIEEDDLENGKKNSSDYWKKRGTTTDKPSYSSPSRMNSFFQPNNYDQQQHQPPQDQRYSSPQSHGDDNRNGNPAEFAKYTTQECYCFGAFFLKASRYLLITTGHLLAGALGVVFLLLGYELLHTQTGPIARAVLSMYEVSNKKLMIAGVGLMFAGAALIYTCLDFFVVGLFF